MSILELFCSVDDFWQQFARYCQLGNVAEQSAKIAS